jgi:hypothetical protein
VTYPPEYSPNSNNSSNDYQSQPDTYSNSGTNSGTGYTNNNPMTGNVAASTPTVLLYMKDGTTYPASDYWIADGKLHYNVDYSGESATDINDLDLQRTVDENAKRGVRFTLKPHPNTYTPDSDTTRVPPNVPTNVITPAPTPAPAETPAPAPPPAVQTTALEQTAAH